MFKQLFLVFLGGGLGSICRFLISKIGENNQDVFPYKTLIVNVLGSFIIGLVLGYALKTESQNQNLILFLAVGFCGGFTTFSTFAFENFKFLKSAAYLPMLTYSLSSLILTLLFVVFGVFLSKFITH
ncbi:MAG: fluoride efflux transporter CrcB [Polaribacter sp.]|nr:fluoride efflux transporter CrcB [Polaribacter sp.]